MTHPTGNATNVVPIEVDRPHAHFDHPAEIVVDHTLSKGEKIRALETMEQDARQLLVGHDPAHRKIAAQKRDRMRLQRQMQMPIILDHLLARGHFRQIDVRFELRHFDPRKQRQIVLVAGALQRPHRP